MECEAEASTETVQQPVRREVEVKGKGVAQEGAPAFHVGASIVTRNKEIIIGKSGKDPNLHKKG